MIAAAFNRVAARLPWLVPLLVRHRGRLALTAMPPDAPLELSLAVADPAAAPVAIAMALLDLAEEVAAAAAAPLICLGGGSSFVLVERAGKAELVRLRAVADLARDYHERPPHSQLLIHPQNEDEMVFTFSYRSSYGAPEPLEIRGLADPTQLRALLRAGRRLAFPPGYDARALLAHGCGPAPVDTCGCDNEACRNYITDLQIYRLQRAMRGLPDLFLVGEVGAGEQWRKGTCVALEDQEQIDSSAAFYISKRYVEPVMSTAQLAELLGPERARVIGEFVGAAAPEDLRRAMARPPAGIDMAEWGRKTFEELSAALARGEGVQEILARSPPPPEMPNGGDPRILFAQLLALQVLFDTLFKMDPCLPYTLACPTSGVPLFEVTGPPGAVEFGATDESACCVCLEEYGAARAPATFSCSHGACAQCAANLERCPICRWII